MRRVLCCFPSISLINIQKVNLSNQWVRLCYLSTNSMLSSIFQFQTVQELEIVVIRRFITCSQTTWCSPWATLWA